MKPLYLALAAFTLAVSRPATAATPVLREPVAGQVVGAPFTIAVDTRGDTYTRAEFFANNAPAGSSEAAPFFSRLDPDTDGNHVLYAILTRPDGSKVPTPSVSVTVQRDLFGGNPRVSDYGTGFVFPDGSVTVAIGQNDSYTWSGMNDLYQGNTVGTEAYIKKLRSYGVNVTRMMLEYAQNQSQLLENPIGTYNPKVLSFWDRFLPLAAKHGLTVLITPWDTFWMDQNWATNPYNSVNGGPCRTKREFITGAAARTAQKARLKMMVDRWGYSTAVFAWDVLNEFDIKWTGATATERANWVADMTKYLQDYELEKWGRRHMTTLSAVNAVPSGTIGNTIYLTPRFDMANTHHYLEHIKDPKNWIDPAMDVNYSVRYSLNYIQDGRPYMDTESGPIDVRPATEEWDARYFHYMLWAHFASGGSGSGMRWPYRNPHILSDAMHESQRALSIVAADFDWNAFRQKNIDSRLTSNEDDLILMGCADDRQAVVWAAQDLRKGAPRPIANATVTLAGMPEGHYYVRARTAETGAVMQTKSLAAGASGDLVVDLPTFEYNIVLTVVPMSSGQVVPGDRVGVADVSAALRIAGGLMDPSREQTINADVETDGRVDVRDALRIAVIAQTAP